MVKYIVPVPRPMDPFINVVYPFSRTVWLLLVASVGSVAVGAMMVYATYSSLGEEYPFPLRQELILFYSMYQKKN